MYFFDRVLSNPGLRDKLFVAWRIIWTKIGSLFSSSCTSLIYVKDLDPVYNEIDESMLYTLFYFLEDFIGQIYDFEGITADNLEEEFKKDLNTAEEFEKKAIEYKRKTFRQLFALYKWWKVERPKRKERDSFSSKFYNDSEPILDQFKKLAGNTEYQNACEQDRKQEDADYYEDFEKMVELLELRDIMWY